MSGPGFGATVALGAVGGTGAWLVWTGWRPSVEPLATVLARFGQPGSQPVRVTRQNLDRRFGARVRRLGPVDRWLDRRRADLRIVDRTPDDQAALLGAFGLLGLFAGPLVLVPRWIAGVPVPLMAAGWVALLGAVIGVVVAMLELRDQAAKRRKAFLHALSAYCISVDMALSVGAGPEQALTAAAADGQGWQFAQLRGALAAARARNDQPWDALRQLGEDVDVTDLIELARTIEHVALRGAVVGDTVAEIADSIQERIAADIERDATRTTVRMAIPATMLLMGFMVLMAYPAVASVLDTY